MKIEKNYLTMFRFQKQCWQQS